jgi:transcriptional regulator with XRE-family HTH domain
MMSRAGGNPHREVGERIADARYQLGRRRGRKLTQKEVAEALSVAEGTVTAWEAGKQLPSPEALLGLAELLEVEAAWVLRGAAEGQEEERREAAQEWIGSRQVSEEGLVSEWEVLRLLGGIAPPGEAAELKADQLQLIRRVAMRQGGRLPGWWYDVLRRVDSGEL